MGPEREGVLSTELATPQIEIEEATDTYARVVAEPLESGFGTTIGNALRRVLLSSLPGAAITSVRIEEVEHEFSTIPGMKEDTMEFLLNVKEIRLRALTDRPGKLYLEASGEGKGHRRRHPGDRRLRDRQPGSPPGHARLAETPT